LNIGLVNVKARLQHLYSDDAAFEFRIEADTKTALARLALPAFATSLADSGPESVTA
jgi:LytS/YehU family sensor histidine kinase